jgi:hypothetical protein
MSETKGMVHPETKFLFISEPVKSDKLSTFKIQCWDRLKSTSPLQKGETENM